MPKNYQISQYDLPLCKGGAVEIKLEGGKTKKIGITRAHLEEDVAKNTHFDLTSGVDFNRAGMPLMEVVSEPDMSSPDEAFGYLTALKEMLISGGVSDCDMEKGQLRCDCNVSVRPVGQKEFGEKVEIKNMNTISGVRRALAYEIAAANGGLAEGRKDFPGNAALGRRVGRDERDADEGVRARLPLFSGTRPDAGGSERRDDRGCPQAVARVTRGAAAAVHATVRVAGV